MSIEELFGTPFNIGYKKGAVHCTTPSPPPCVMAWGKNPMNKRANPYSTEGGETDHATQIKL